MRGVEVMIDRDLAEFYGVQTGRLNEAVKRNARRFPEAFMFQLSPDEFELWKSQIAISSEQDSGYLKKGVRHRPFAFTEQGIAMLASVLHSEKAIDVSIRIINAFVAMRRMLMTLSPIVARLDKVEQRQFESDRKLDTIFDALDRGNLLPSGILPSGTEFDSLRFVTRLVESAKSEIVLIDPYADAVALDVLAKKAKDVKVRLVVKATNWAKPTATEIHKFNRQYGGLTVERSDGFHDRFMIIDNEELWNLGASVNCIGRRLTTYSTRDSKEIAKVLAQI